MRVERADRWRALGRFGGARSAPASQAHKPGSPLGFSGGILKSVAMSCRNLTRDRHHISSTRTRSKGPLGRPRASRGVGHAMPNPSANAWRCREPVLRPISLSAIRTGSLAQGDKRPAAICARAIVATYRLTVAGLFCSLTQCSMNERIVVGTRRKVPHPRESPLPGGVRCSEK